MLPDIVLHMLLQSDNVQCRPSLCSYQAPIAPEKLLSLFNAAFCCADDLHRDPSPAVDTEAADNSADSPIMID